MNIKGFVDFQQVRTNSPAAFNDFVDELGIGKDMHPSEVLDALLDGAISFYDTDEGLTFVTVTDGRVAAEDDIALLKDGQFVMAHESNCYCYENNFRDENDETCTCVFGQFADAKDNWTGE